MSSSCGTRSAAHSSPAPCPSPPGIWSIAFDPSGQRFATTATQDGAIKVFDTSTLQQEGTTLSTDQRTASTAAFERHSTSLLVVNDYGNGFTWPMALATWEQRACAVARRNLTPKEWSTYLPGQSYTRVCP